MPPRAVIKTARLTLRPLSDADEKNVVAGIGDYGIACWLTTAPHPYRPEDFHSFLGTARPGKVWAIDDGGGCCGAIGLDPTLGYWLARRVWGRGYATEAARAVLAVHFADPASGSVHSGCFAGNSASRNVLTKLGFQPDGFRLTACRASGDSAVLVQCMALTRDDWRAAVPS